MKTIAKNFFGEKLYNEMMDILKQCKNWASVECLEELGFIVRWDMTMPSYIGPEIGQEWIDIGMSRFYLNPMNEEFWEKFAEELIEMMATQFFMVDCLSILLSIELGPRCNHFNTLFNYSYKNFEDVIKFMNEYVNMSKSNFDLFSEFGFVVQEDEQGDKYILLPDNVKVYSVVEEYVNTVHRYKRARPFIDIAGVLIKYLSGELTAYDCNI